MIYSPVSFPFLLFGDKIMEDRFILIHLHYSLSSYFKTYRVAALLKVRMMGRTSVYKLIAVSKDIMFR